MARTEATAISAARAGRVEGETVKYSNKSAKPGPRSVQWDGLEGLSCPSCSSDDLVIRTNGSDSTLNLLRWVFCNGCESLECEPALTNEGARATLMSQQ